MLNVSNIKEFCDNSDIFAAGQAIHTAGNLRKVHTTHVDQDSRIISGLVLGNFGYYHNTSVTLNARLARVIENFSCDCHELKTHKEDMRAKVLTPCRHCVALALSAALPETETEAPLPAAVPEPQDAPAAAEEDWDFSAESVDPAPDLPLESDVSEVCADPVESGIPAEPEVHVELKGMEILFGHHLDINDENGDPAPLFWTPNDTGKVFHTNTGIIGTMGTGKTQFTKSLVTQLCRQQENNFDGSPLGILIFDYKGDYNSSQTDFINATNATVLQPCQLPFNPLALFKPRVHKPLLPVHTANAFKDTLSKVYRLGPKQQTALSSCIMEAYRQCGILPEDPRTWGKRAPTFDMVNEIYEQNEDLPKNDSLAAAMQKLSLFQIFQSNPYRTSSLFDLLQGVVVIDLSGYDADIQSLVVAITLDQFYAQMHASGSSATDGQLRRLTKMILVDEADNFMGEDFPALKKIMKEGREFGVGTILSTQFLDHFITGEDNYSRYILSWIVHNVSDLKRGDVEYIFKVKSGSPEAVAIYDTIKSSDRFQSTVKIGNAPVCHIRDKAFFEL